MNNETAQRLKEAGFKVPMGANELWKPSVGELIKACGDNLRWVKHNIHDKKVAWLAQGCQSLTGNKGKDIRCRAETIEEAVSNLWLEINKK